MSIDTMLAAREAAMRRTMTSSHPSPSDVRLLYGNNPPPGVWASTQVIDPQHPERAEYKLRLEWQTQRGAGAATAPAHPSHTHAAHHQPAPAPMRGPDPKTTCSALVKEYYLKHPDEFRHASVEQRRAYYGLPP
jgi:hypothetical protein